MDNTTSLRAEDTRIEDSVEHALELLDQAITILDGEDLLIAAAKVDDVRNALRKSAYSDHVMPWTKHSLLPPGSRQ